MNNNILISICCIFTFVFLSLNSHAQPGKDITNCISKCDKYYSANNNSTEGFTYFTKFLNRPLLGFSDTYCNLARSNVQTICYDRKGAPLEACKSALDSDPQGLKKSCIAFCVKDIMDQCQDLG